MSYPEVLIKINKTRLINSSLPKDKIPLIFCIFVCLSFCFAVCTCYFGFLWFLVGQSKLTTTFL